MYMNFFPIFYGLIDSLGRPIHSDTVTCQDCAVKYLKEAAYFYRRDIPNNDLPSELYMYQ